MCRSSRNIAHPFLMKQGTGKANEVQHNLRVTVANGFTGLSVRKASPDGHLHRATVDFPCGAFPRKLGQCYQNCPPTNGTRTRISPSTGVLCLLSYRRTIYRTSMSANTEVR